MRISDWSSDVCSSDLALILREEVQRLPVSREWQRLRWTPVSAIMGVTGLPAEGADFALPIGAYGVDIDGNGDGWVRVTASGAAGRADGTLMAGLETDWGGMAGALRQGVVGLGGVMIGK